jgi:hypothetical protein
MLQPARRLGTRDASSRRRRHRLPLHQCPRFPFGLSFCCPRCWVPAELSSTERANRARTPIVTLNAHPNKLPRPVLRSFAVMFRTDLPWTRAATPFKPSDSRCSWRRASRSPARAREPTFPAARETPRAGFRPRGMGRILFLVMPFLNGSRRFRRPRHRHLASENARPIPSTCELLPRLTAITSYFDFHKYLICRLSP